MASVTSTVQDQLSRCHSLERSNAKLAKSRVLPFSPYVLITAAALYTHYFSFTIVILENLAFALIFRRFWRHRRAWVLWMLTQLAVVVLYLPWLGHVYSRLGAWPAVSEALDLQTLVYRVFLAFSLGLSWEAAPGWAYLLFGALAVAGILRVKGEEGKRGKGGPFALFPFFPFPLMYVGVLVLAMYVLSLQRPMYNPKFLLLAAPAYFVLLALGVQGIRRTVESGLHLLARGIRRSPYLAGTSSVVILLLMLAGTSFAAGQSLSAYYFDPKHARDDYRGISRYIELSAQPKDAIILNAPGQAEIFGYYYKGSLPVFPLPRQRPMNERAAREELSQVASDHRRIWVVFWGEREADPEGVIESWLDENTFRAGNRWFGKVRLVLYSVPVATTAGTIERQIDANLGNKISLLGYSLNRGGGGAGTSEARPGEVLQLTLFWKAFIGIEERYVVFTHLLDLHEHIWGQRDAEPGSGSKPTTGWASGAVISDNYGIPIVLGTPPGEYYVEVGLYLPASGQRLLLLGDGGEIKGDRVLFGPVKVGKADAPPSIDSLLAEFPTSADFGPLRLVGYEFYKLGFDRGNVDFHRGDIARLALHWQARERPGRDYEVILRLLDRNGQAVFTKRNAPADGNYATGQWEKGEVVLDQHKILLDLPPGSYKLTVAIVDGNRSARDKGEALVLRDIVIR